MFARQGLFFVALTCASLPAFVPPADAISPRVSEARGTGQEEPEPLDFPEPEIVERVAFRNDVLRALAERKFDELTELAKDIRTTKARFANGSWKLRSFYDAFSQLGYAPKWYPVDFEGKDPDWEKTFARLDEWQNAYPESITPRVAHAHAMNAYAWHARSRQWARDVGRDQWELFSERLAASSKILEAAKKLKEQCPGWFVASERLANGQGWDKETFAALVREAVAYEPEYFAIYQLQAHYLLPRWHGEPGEWEREAARWATELDSGLATEVYARTLWYLRDTGNWDNLLKENHVDWPLAQRGFLHILQEYPDSFEVKSVFTLLSVQARDRNQARLLFLSVGREMDRGVWRTEKQFRWSRNWASQTERPK